MARTTEAEKALHRQERRRQFHALYRAGAPDACWEWEGRTAGGYGRFGYGGRDRGAHVLALVLRGVEVPKGMVVMHSCDNPPCVNPHHLRVATQAENRRDCAAKGRTATGERNGMNTHPERRPDGRHGNQRKGEAHPMARLTPEQVASIRSRYTGKRGELSHLAAEFGVSRPHVARIVSGRSWAVTTA